ncbi:hypothetical protein SAMN05216388_10254 [Halorientalis persicus]|uniref:Uncharacterized protein n=1 Tax=Halorientalis persicus TaxID=1367881 RepID=A0A1H8U0L3_9EURY|nr:hypothetical protein SAMN05216388_10254 [Halorientalis persicus]
MSYIIRVLILVWIAVINTRPEFGRQLDYGRNIVICFSAIFTVCYLCNERMIF